MKHLLALAIVLLSSLGACSSNEVTQPKAPLKEPEIVATPPEAIPSLKELESREFARPQDAHIKWLLALRHWCDDRHGLAVEHWLWLTQFASPDALERRKAQSVMAQLRAGQSDRLKKQFGCAEH